MVRAAVRAAAAAAFAAATLFVAALVVGPALEGDWMFTFGGAAVVGPFGLFFGYWTVRHAAAAAGHWQDATRRLH